MTNAEMQAR